MTQRGVAVLNALADLVPDAELTVISTPGEAWEPNFLEDLQHLARRRGGRYVEARDLGRLPGNLGWSLADLDLLLLAHWRVRVPASAYRALRQGTFVFHDSLLPAYRGFSPTSWAIINGEARTGATLFAIAEEFDAGDIIGQRAVPIGPDDSIAAVMERVTDAYVSLLQEHLAGLLAGTAPRQPQDHGAASYGCKRVPDDNRIDWTLPARSIHNLVRAVTHPYPGAFTTLDGKRLRVWATRPEHSRRYVGRRPGAVVEVRPGAGSVVLAGDGTLLLQRVQVEGGAETEAAQVLAHLSDRLGP